MNKIILAILAATMLTACGYTPLYAPGEGGATAAHKVEVGKVEGTTIQLLPGERRTAQRVAAKLRLDFPDSAATLDLLEVSIQEQTATLAVEKTATTSRAEIILNATLMLTDPNGKAIFRTNLSTSSAYNVEDSPYSTEAGKDFARLTAADNLATDISRRVALYYAHPTTAPTGKELEAPKAKHHSKL